MAPKITRYAMLLFLLACGSQSSAQLTSTFFKTYRLSQTFYERAQALLPISQGNLLVAGQTSSCTGTNCYNASSVLRMDSTGNILWRKKIGGVDNQNITRIVPSSATEAIVTGFNSGDLFCFKVSHSGDILWQRLMTYPGYNYSGDLVKSKSNYYLVGNNGYGNDTSFIYSFNDSGDKNWAKQLHTAGHTIYANTMDITPDGQMLLISQLKDPGNGYQGTGLTLLDTNGNVLAGKIINNGFVDYTDPTTYTVTYSSDDHFIITYKDYQGRHIAKLNRQLGIVWSKVWSTSVPFYSYFVDKVVADKSGGLWLGSFFSQGTGIGMVHFDSDGDVLSSNKFSYNDEINIMGATVSPECNFIICGLKRINGYYHQYVGRLDAAGKISCLNEGFTVTVQPESLTATNLTFTTAEYAMTASDPSFLIETPPVYDEVLACSGTTTACVPTAPSGVEDLSVQDIQLHPNPATDQVRLTLPGGINSCQVTILDAQGRSLYTRRITSQQPNLDVSMLPAGFYAMKIETGKNTIVQKLVKQ